MARNTLIYLLISFAFCLQSVRADVLTSGIKDIKGTFEGFHDNRFIFRDSKGKTHKLKREKVQRLVMEKPTRVAFTASRKKRSGARMLKGYKGLKFVFVEGEKEKKVFAGRVKSISVIHPAGGSGGKDAKGADTFPVIDISGLETRSDLTEQQTDAIDRYKKAREAYDSFLAESSKLVARMDRERGGAREKLLDELRVRKDREQPIKNELRAAIRELMATCPFERAE